MRSTEILSRRSSGGLSLGELYKRATGKAEIWSRETEVVEEPMI
jgi:hypothetical protein